MTLFRAAAASILVAGLVAGCRAPEPEERQAAADSVWYHESDVALVGATNRPQLVEFFHPG